MPKLTPRRRAPRKLPRRITLPAPALQPGRSLRSALQRRKTTREIAAKALDLQTLSNLLWAAFGINRKHGPFGLPGRTAASASNSQELDIYVLLPRGGYVYDAARHALTPVSAEDLRALAISHGQQSAGADAPVRLVYVADVDRLANTAGYQEPSLHDPAVQRSYYYVDTGLIAGNVYLFAAAFELAAWFHNCDRDALAPKLGLRAEQRVLFAQTVGYPR